MNRFTTTPSAMEMTQALYHPPHVAEALDSIEGLEGDELKAAIRYRGSTSKPKLPDEALIRIIRRASVDGDEAMEGFALKALMGRLAGWAWGAYSSFSDQDRKDLVSELGLVIIKAVRKTTAIDFWEITFAKLRDRAAADVYQDHYVDLYQNVHETHDVEIHDESDSGARATELVELALIDKRWEKILMPEEMRYLHLLFLSDIPLSSPRASTDLVRMTGKAEGTLREIKTKLKNKLKAAWELST